MQELAEVTADLMSEAVLYNLDALVATDYLDARLDARFAELDVRLSERFAEVDARFAQVDARFAELRGEIEGVKIGIKGELRLVHALQALLVAGVFIPQLQAWFTG